MLKRPTDRAPITSLAQDVSVKERSRAGFTLVEMLVALALMILMTAMVTVGVSVGLQTYRQSTFTSQSAILSNTIDSALSDPFRNMTSASDENGTTVYTIVYRDDAQGATIVDPQLKTNNGRLYIVGKNLSGNAAEVTLLNGSAYADCAVTDVSLTLSAGNASGTYKIQSTVDENLSKDYSFSFVPVSPIEKSPTN